MSKSPLDRIDVAAPCPARWDDMKGDGRTRFCEQCKLHVYNLSGMERAEAEKLVTQTEGRLCVAFFRRADGTVLTDDCPIGLAARARKHVRRAVAVVAGILGLGLVGGCVERWLEREAAPPPGPVAGELIVIPPPRPPAGVAPDSSGTDTDDAAPTSGR